MIWHLVSGLAGIIIGLILGVLIDKDTFIRYVVRKIKIKQSSGVSDVVTIDNLKDEIGQTRRQRRQERRKNRK